MRAPLSFALSSCLDTRTTDPWTQMPAGRMATRHTRNCDMCKPSDCVIREARAKSAGQHSDGDHRRHVRLCPGPHYFASAALRLHKVRDLCSLIRPATRSQSPIARRSCELSQRRVLDMEIDLDRMNEHATSVRLACPLSCSL